MAQFTVLTQYSEYGDAFAAHHVHAVDRDAAITIAAMYCIGSNIVGCIDGFVSVQGVDPRNLFVDCAAYLESQAGESGKAEMIKHIRAHGLDPETEGRPLVDLVWDISCGDGYPCNPDKTLGTPAPNIKDQAMAHLKAWLLDNIGQESPITFDNAGQVDSAAMLAAIFGKVEG